MYIKILKLKYNLKIINLIFIKTNFTFTIKFVIYLKLFI